MLPALPAPHPPSPELLGLLDALGAGGFRGERSIRLKDRFVAATDNSVYQCLPAAVLFPKDSQDLCTLLRESSREPFQKIPLTPRGGGTGTNGQSLSSGVVVDLSRHMRSILEINLQERWARVQPGVVLDQLNRELAPHGLKFAPDLSPSNRATLGGMIGTDASGKGSRVYGKTSQHVLELQLALVDGTSFCSKSIPSKGRKEALAALPQRVQRIYRELEGLLHANRKEIKTRFPPLRRFLSGYNLPHIFPEGPDGPMSLNPLICGSEGTLAFVSEAKLRLVPTEEHKALWVLTYPTFQAALQDARALVSIKPGAIETVDDTILALAREDAIWHRVSHILDPLPREEVAAINLVELWASSEAELHLLRNRFESMLAGPDSRSTAAIMAPDEPSAAALWDLRKKGVGLLGARPGARRPVAFVEDSVVPPERLPEYIAAFREILDQEKLDYGMFGHVDVGCLHVRPALNLREKADRDALKRISDKVQALAASFGGVLWGEHGRGYRSAYTPDFFGETIYGVFRSIKSLFDPRNQLNPGKIATAKKSDHPLIPVDSLTRGHRDAKIAPKAIAHYAPVVNCNGNAVCMNVLPDALMCPSSKITRDRVHSPKGRATLMREWLTLLSEAGMDPAKIPAHELPKQFSRWFRNPKRVSPDKDFSVELWEAMHGCLACKACTTLCPIHVDIPTVRAEFLAHFYSRYRRPLRDHLVGAMEQGAALMSVAPRLSALATGRGPGRWLMKKAGGLVDLPAVSSPSFSRLLSREKLRLWSVDALVAARSDADKSVVLVQDPVTSFYESKLMASVVRLVARLGFEPRVLSFGEHGKGLHVKGFLRRFESVAHRQSARLRAVADSGYRLVGVDPAYTLAYRDEYRSVLANAAHPPEVLMLQEWLAGLPLALRKGASAHRYMMFGHCTERSLSPQSPRLWTSIFEKFGMELSHAQVGCCGMGGAFGHQVEHLQESKGIFELSWKAPLEKACASDGLSPVLSGFSCRSQCKRFAGVKLPHPAQVLEEHLSSGAA